MRSVARKFCDDCGLVVCECRCRILGYPSPQVQLLATTEALTALKLLRRDEQAALKPQTDDSIARAKAAQASERDALLCQLAADPNGTEARLWLARRFMEDGL